MLGLGTSKIRDSTALARKSTAELVANLVAMYARRHCPCGLYSVISAVFIVSAMCFLVALRSLNQEHGKSNIGVKLKVDVTKRPTDSLLLGENMFYVDKLNYRVAIGYEDKTGLNGVNADEEENDAASTAGLPEFVEKRPAKSSLDQNIDGNQIAYANTTSSFSQDDEETIDQNMVAEKYKEEINGKVSKFQCTPEAPLTNLVLVKTHRTGSTSIGNIFYRFGDSRNLSFVLPSAASFQYFWPLRFHPSHTRLDLLNKAMPNMAINIGRYSKRHILPMMPNNTVVLTILRDPVRHFESVYEYADISRLIGLSNTSRDPFATFLEAPRSNVIEYVKDTKTFAIELNLLKNGMAFDLGLEHTSYSNEEEIEGFIAKLEEQLDLVLINEYLDESLILFKRLMCWELDDIIYIKHKVRNEAFRNNITEQQKAKIDSWNKADVLLYAHFNKSLWEKIGQQSSDFFAEVDNFRAIVNQITGTCFVDNHLSKSFEIPVVMKHDVPQEMRDLCEKLMLRDRGYIKMLKEKQSQMIRDENQKLLDKQFYRESNESRIYFAYDNASIVNRSFTTT